MNLGFVWIAGWLVWQNKKYLEDHDMKMMEMEGGGKIKTVAVTIFILINVLGVEVLLYTQLF